MDHDPSLQTTAAFDQLSGTLSSMAGLFGAYQQALYRNGLSPEMTSRMVRDYAWLTLCRMVYPEFPPPMPPE